SEALHFYQKYLAKQPDAANRAEVLAKIDRLQTLIEEQKKLIGQRPDGSESPPLNAGASPAARKAPAEAVAASPSEPPFWTRRRVSYAVAGAGAVALVGGV